MDHVPELWRELKLEFKDNVKKKELRKSLLEEENINKNNILRNSHIDLNESNESNESIIIDNTIKDTMEKENIYGKIEKKKIRKRLHCIIC